MSDNQHCEFGQRAQVSQEAWAAKELAQQDRPAACRRVAPSPLSLPHVGKSGLHNSVATASCLEPMLCLLKEMHRIEMAC